MENVMEEILMVKQIFEESFDFSKDNCLDIDVSDYSCSVKYRNVSVVSCTSVNDVFVLESPAYLLEGEDNSVAVIFSSIEESLEAFKNCLNRVHLLINLLDILFNSNARIIEEQSDSLKAVCSLNDKDRVQISLTPYQFTICLEVVFGEVLQPSVETLKLLKCTIGLCASSLSYVFVDKRESDKREESSSAIREENNSVVKEESNSVLEEENNSAINPGLNRTEIFN